MHWKESCIRSVQQRFNFESVVLVHPIYAILNQELATKMLQIQSKRFYLDVKQNKRGKFIKVYSYKYKSFKIQMQTIFIWWPGCRDKCGRPKGPDLHGSLHCRFLTKHSLNQWEKYLIICGMYFWKQTWRVFVVFSGVQRSTFCFQRLLLLPGPPKPRSVAGNVHVSNLGPNTTESNMARNRVGPALVSWSVKISFVVANFHPCFQILLLRMASWSLKWWSRYKTQDKETEESIIVLYPSRTTGVTTWTWRKTPGEGFSHYLIVYFY